MKGSTREEKHRVLQPYKGFILRTAPVIGRTKHHNQERQQFAAVLSGCVKVPPAAAESMLWPLVFWNPGIQQLYKLAPMSMFERIQVSCTHALHHLSWLGVTKHKTQTPQKHRNHSAICESHRLVWPSSLPQGACVRGCPRARIHRQVSLGSSLFHSRRIFFECKAYVQQFQPRPAEGSSIIALPQDERSKNCF
jgi:hypothetical protein